LETLLKNYSGNQRASVGEAFDPTPENIEKRIERGKLASGLQYAMLPKQTRGNAVHMTLALRFGDENSLAGRRIPAQFAASMLMRGTVNHTRKEIEDTLTRLKARITIAGTPTGITAQIQTVRANAPEVLGLAAEVLRAPSFPAAEFEQSLQSSLTAAEASRRDTQLLATAAMRRYLIPYSLDDPRTFPITPEERIAQLHMLTLDSVRKFHSEFYGASNGELVAVGDFDAAALRTLLDELFGSWKSPKPYRDVEAEPRAVAPIRRMIDVPEKGNAVFLAGAFVRVLENDVPALILANQMIGVLDGRARLYLRLRAKDGLSYGVGSSLQINWRGSSVFFQGIATAAPQNVPKVEAAYREEFDRAARDGFSAEEVAQAKAGFLQSLRLQRSRDEALAQALQSLLRDGRTMVWQSEFEKRVEAVTPQQAMQVVRRYLQSSQQSVFAAGDFESAGVVQ
jgi:zinc protease